MASSAHASEAFDGCSDLDMELLDLTLGDTGVSPLVKQEPARADNTVKEDILGASPKAVKRPLPSDGHAGASPNPKFTRKSSMSSGTSAGRVEDRNAPGDEKKKICEGCNRTLGVSPCWFVQGETVPWAMPHGRGLWCKDCHNIWRTSFSGCSALTWFPRWLANTENRASWDLHLLAYMSLTHEGVSKVSIGCIAQRVNVLKYVHDVAAIPLRSRTVMPLSDVVARGIVENVDDLQLVTIKMNGGDVLGVFRPY
jgi:hypothetical protein